MSEKKLLWVLQYSDGSMANRDGVLITLKDKTDASDISEHSDFNPEVLPLTEERAQILEQAGYDIPSKKHRRSHHKSGKGYNRYRPIRQIFRRGGRDLLRFYYLQ